VVLSADIALGEEALVLRDTQGKKIKPLDAGNKKAVLLIFILQDCPVANQYAPEISRIAKEYDRSIETFLVHVDPALTAEQAAKHAKEYGYSITVLLDPDHRLVESAKAVTAPEAVLFSPTGEIVYRGRIDDRVAEIGKKRFEPKKRDLRDAIDAVLAGKPVAQPFSPATGCLIGDYKKKESLK